MEMRAIFSLLYVILSVSCSLSAATELGSGANSGEEDNNSEPRGLHNIEGRVYPPDPPFTANGWPMNVRIHVNGGRYLGFVKSDGAFVVHNVPSGSYILEILSPEFTYEPVRVEINSKGKFRARKVNYIQTNLIIQLPYPLKLKPLGRTRYFQQREQWRITDFLFNPMVLMMLVPFGLLMVLPKLLNDPEAKKEMEHISSLTKFEMPEMSDLVTNFLAGTSQTQTQAAKKVSRSAKKRQ